MKLSWRSRLWRYGVITSQIVGTKFRVEALKVLLLLNEVEGTTVYVMSSDPFAYEISIVGS